MNDIWFVYILECSDKSFYCGITNDLDKRFITHSEGKGAKYTRTRLPLKLIHVEEYQNRSLAAKREYQIKQLSRKQKEEIIFKKTTNLKK
jgi:putative endonuclease